MSYLSVLLVVKIAVTIVAVVIPFLTFPKRKLDELAGFGSPNIVLYRLYGVAILALVVAYAGGLRATLMGVFPIEIVVMGLVSNMGASVVMVATGYGATQRVATLFFVCVGLGFAAALGFPALAMRQI